MARKNRMHTNAAKTKRASYAGTITKADFLKMASAERRSDQIASGINPTSGCGVHGDTKGNSKKRRRRAARKLIQNWDG